MKYASAGNLSWNVSSAERVHRVMRRTHVGCLLVLMLVPCLALAQSDQPPAQSVPLPPATPAVATASNSALSSALSGDLSNEEVRLLIQKAAENDIVNDQKQRNYTYTERAEERRLDGTGQVSSTESTTREVMMLYGEPVERLVRRNDQPLSEKEASKEEQRIQKIMEKRKNETEEERKKRLEREAKEREEEREFVREVSDAYTFHVAGLESVDGRETYVIDADPRPDFHPHSKEAKYLSKVRGRIWIDKTDGQWMKVDIEALDTLSFGLFLARVHPGTHIVVEQTRVNDEVWLPKHVWLKLDAKIALLKNYNLTADITYTDYKKFRADTKILGSEVIDNQ
ncbi:MAG TPA: hypothetical protein VMH03_06240 [Terriglobales bacterium]|nr:hypothetical protein [Terriglobales bacterium]